VAVDRDDNLFIADLGNNRVRRVSRSGVITTVAGGADSTLNQPRGVAVDAAGNLFIADSHNFSIRKVSPDGVMTTVAGDGFRAFSGDGGPATSARLDFPTRVSLDDRGNLFIVDGGRIRKVSSDGIIATVAGNGTCCYSGDGGPATSAQMIPVDVAAGAAGDLFIAGYFRILKISQGGIIGTVAGNGLPASFGFSGDGGPAASARLNLGRSTAVDSRGNLFIADTGNHRIRKVSPAGVITTSAGTGSAGYSGDGGPATSAQLNLPVGVAVDGDDNILVAEFGNKRVRRISVAGVISTVRGTGGDDAPIGVAIGPAGNLFITYFDGVRKVSPDGLVTLVAGGGTLLGSAADGKPATDANLASLCGGAAVDSAGNLFIAGCFQGGRVYQVSPDGVLTTYAGGAGPGPFSGDGGPAKNAELGTPFGLALDSGGNLLIGVSNSSDDGSAGNENERIRKVSPGGVISTIAGAGTSGYSGDGGLAIRAELSGPTGLSVDRAGNLYFVDIGNNVVRVLRPVTNAVWIGALVDAATQRPDPVAPGKIVVIYGTGFGTSPAGDTVAFNGIAATLLYISPTQIAAIVPYAITGTRAEVTITHQGETSAAFVVPVAPSAPGIFTSNQTGAGQAAAINDIDGTVNSAVNPVKVGGYISLYATGEGQTKDSSAGAQARPILPVSVRIGGIEATVQYAGGAPGQTVGLMQVNVQIPNGVQPAGYVPVVLQVGDVSTTPGAVWIAVSGN
jgi:uncharacterized protein (TIGR03437 family)